MDVDLDALAGPDAPAALALLRAHSPVTWFAPIDGWLVTGYDLAVRVLQDADAFTVDDPRFSTAQVVGPSMLSLDGREHHRHRIPFGGAYRTGRVEHAFADVIRTTAVDLLSRLRPPAELRSGFAGPLAVAVMVESLGLVGVDATMLLDWYRAIVAAVSAISAGEVPQPGVDDAVAELGAHIGAGLTGDSVLALARDRLTEREVISNAAVMLFGGLETVEGMIGSAIGCQLDEGLAEVVRHDRTLLPAAVEESLRLEPAAAALDRYATTDVMLGPAQIRAGQLVRVSVAAANRDPSVFPDPDRFDLQRANAGDHLAFARGPHACIAAGLARLECRIALDVLLDLPGLSLVQPAPVTGLIFRKPHSVVVGWDV